MKDKSNLDKLNEKDVISWKLYIKELYLKGDITEGELKIFYPINFRFDKLNTVRELIVSELIINMIERDIKNKDLESMRKLIQNDVNILLDGKVEKISEKEWCFYLFECFHHKLITEEKYEVYKKSINFNKPLTKEEQSIINNVLDILRIRLVNSYPETIKFMESPSFDVLMAANKIA